MLPNEQRRLFVSSWFEGCLACALCEGELFQTTASLRRMIVPFRLKGTPLPAWLDVSKERERRRQHGEQHVRRGEALRDDAGVFLLPPEPAPPARTFGFHMEMAQ